ncbi:MAG: DNA translocase FtsK [Prevotella sp.]|nr:DNA translocase FtsK [Prevotella sp.]MDY5667479.1 DNA translocase FtsK [Alloprevotella sp.]
MAKKATTSKRAPKRNGGTTPAPISLWQQLKQGNIKARCKELWSNCTHADNIRFIVGLCVMCISIYLIISFVSNVFTGRIDQSYVQNGELTHAANYGGRLGAYISNYFMDMCFGLFSLLIPIFTLLAGIKLVGNYHIRLWKWFLNFSIIMIWGSVFLSLVTDILPTRITNFFSFRLGGGHGDFVKNYLTNNLGSFGAWIVVLATAVFYLMYLTSETVNVVRRMMHPQDFIKDKLPRKGNANDELDDEGDEENDASVTYNGEANDAVDENDEDNETQNTFIDLNLSHDEKTSCHDDDSSAPVSIDLDTHSSQVATTASMPSTATGSGEMEIHATTSEAPLPHQSGTDTKLDIAAPVVDDKAHGKTVEEVLAQEPYDPRKDLPYYKFPTIPLLKHYDENGPAIDMAEQNANKDRIINVLRNFGVEISSIKATIGPTITLYEVTPAPGVRINKIRNLEDDIALSLAALGIRIIAPIPGKGTIGIEVPNKNPRIVSMESIINTRKFQESTFELPIALGKTITNEVFMVDLAKMPHLLVAGATGQGKSVGLNAIITSLLYKKHPSELKFVMIDPKKVEFSIYAPIERHFLAKIPDDNEDPIITDVTKVVQTLKSLCQLMDHRYDLLKKAKVRNIKEYNAKFKSRLLPQQYGHEFMPYIVVIIDEFGDLIMTAGKEVELPIARIAQLARAVGIHMVIATQRPTTNIITGTIKANFPARMAFKVMSQIDSRTILDQGGANQLVGKGDMLFLCGNAPTRVQCAFVDTPEVEKINEYISSQHGYVSAFELPEPEMDDDNAKGPGDLSGETLDALFEEAARLIVIHQQGSTSLIQRKFSIGFNRAGRLMDQLERAGIVGPTRGSKPREVLCSDEIELDNKIAALHNM